MKEKTKEVQKQATETVQEPTVTAPEQPAVKPTKSKKPIIIALIILLVLAAGAVGGYFIYKKIRLSNPMSITTDLFNKLENSSKDITKDKAFKTIMTTEPTNYKIEANVMGMVSVEFGFGVDLKNNLLALSVNASSGGESLLQMLGQADKDGLSVVPSKDSKGAYTYGYETSEIFKVASKAMDFASNSNSEKIFTYLKESFNETYKEDYFKKDDNKFTTEITPERVEKLASTFVKKLKNDKELINGYIDFVNGFSSIIGEEKITSEDIYEILDDLVDDLVEMAEDYKITYTIQVDGINTVKYQIAADIKDYDAKFYLNYIVDGDLEEINIRETYEGENYTILKYSVSNKEVIYENDTIAVKYDRKDEKVSVKYDGQEIATGTIKVDESKGKVSITANLTVGNDDQKIPVTLKITAENVSAKDLIKVDTDKYTALDLSKEENMEAFMEELQDNPIFEMIGSFFGSNDDWDSVDGYDDDWDDDDWDWEDDEDLDSDEDEEDDL